MQYAEFHVYSTLNDFLPPERRQTPFTHLIKEKTSIKDAVESLGIPHPEIDLIVVNEESVDFSYSVQDGDRIHLYPVFATPEQDVVSKVRPAPLQHLRFVLDVHLGKLATSLRLLGFDVWYRNHADDGELAAISSQEQRILLTQDRGLLKRRIVTYGYFVRSRNPQEQLLEVIQRFKLSNQATPLTRCLCCNGCLKSVAKEAIADQLLPLTQEFYDEFVQCQTCHQIYWKGTHYERLQQRVAENIS
jgi:uncharacterized protein with PIN domain